MDYKGANERKETLRIIYFPAFHKTERNTTSDFPSPEVQRGVQIENPIYAVQLPAFLPGLQSDLLIVRRIISHITAIALKGEGISCPIAVHKTQQPTH